mmetsp:Transcript_3435/g.9947  ORF Transcript_3435/g.9947 Transcript_3435/m.9947 type:complete len:442 (+) Transcript_3435:112-1437(+)|eukprot:CAMPEP_0206150036 /NCGR_PEP_ID=MMETSP1473-20131121/38090_1 /ASSEMBLY_ACC=CAM_ASM_001109 /TAXON_ID=1461547 /ORGANISM="Stichococcus sp, Strain RCC1054" /LENGTH=441 /DNA_ID=CAMNT_0053547525 /DNA_START=51 /DNA_END=1376 /DNA_ORIENTATION=+
MSLEATVVCVDNSEWTRNGDYAPNRFQAQADAVNLLAGAKTQANPENTVGVLTMAGKKPTILVTPTADLGKVLNSMASLQIEGETNFSASSQIAQLALKHRQNKNQRQRIVMFVGSPLSETKEQLVRIAKKLKKNNVAVDVVSFGDNEANEEKLAAFTEAVTSGDSSHLVTVPAGTILSDQLFGSPIYQTDGGGGYAAGGGGAEGGGGGGEGFEFGVDANMDPELAMALRVSLEEERARQGAAGEGQAAESAATPAGTAAADGGGGGEEPMDEDALLQQALAMSMDVDEPAPAGGMSEAPAQTPAASSAPAATPAAPQKPPAPAEPSVSAAQPAGDAHEESAADLLEEVDDPELAAALAMSMEDYGGASEAAPPTTPAAPEGDAAMGELLGDADYMASVLATLPGVDPNDPALQETLRSLQQDGSKDGSKQPGSDDKKEGS